MTAKTNDDSILLLQALVTAMEQALSASKRDERAECEAIWAQMRQPGGFRRRLIAWRKRRYAGGDEEGGSDVGAGVALRPRRRR